jgi:hypothetical protein
MPKKPKAKSKKSQPKLRDLKPKKDAKGGRKSGGDRVDLLPAV